MIKANNQFLLLLLVFASIFLSREVVADQCSRCLEIQRIARKKIKPTRNKCPRKCKNMLKKKKYQLESNCGTNCCIEICRKTKEACINVGFCQSPTACLYPEATYPDDFDASLTTIDLSSTELDSIPCSILLQEQLEFLLLNDNEIEDIATEIGLLTALITFVLFDNEIEDIPTEMGLLRNLQNLLLYNNEIEFIPTEIGQLSNLRNLLLYNNLITSIPTDIGKLTNLSQLLLHNNEISSLPSEIGLLENLNMLELDFSGNTIPSLPDEIKELCTNGVTVCTFD